MYNRREYVKKKAREMFKPKPLIKNTVKNQILVLSVISILAISILSQDASASVLSASNKNSPQASADIFSINNTSSVQFIKANNNGKLFVKAGADFNNSTSVFDSSKLCIRNPASTFTTCLTNGAIVANRTLNWPVLTGTDTVATLGLGQTFTGANTFSGNNVIDTTSSGLIIRNPASTFAYTLTGGAIVANRTLNIPITTTTDTLATLGLAQSFSGLQTFTGVGASITITPTSGIGEQDINGGPTSDATLRLVTPGRDTFLFNASYAGRTLGIGVYGVTPAMKANIASPYFQFNEGTTGGGTAQLGTNSPASTNTAPYTWIKVRSADGSTVYIPAWK